MSAPVDVLATVENGRLMRPELSHSRSSLSDSDFFTLIDETGGWPVGYGFVGFEHTDNRKAGFCNTSRNTGWWTVVASADDYFLWKLSPEAVQRVIDAAIGSARVTTQPLKSLYIRNSQGYRAALSKFQEGA